MQPHNVYKNIYYFGNVIKIRRFFSRSPSISEPARQGSDWQAMCHKYYNLCGLSQIEAIWCFLRGFQGCRALWMPLLWCHSLPTFVTQLPAMEVEEWCGCLKPTSDSSFPHSYFAVRLITAQKWQHNNDHGWRSHRSLKKKFYFYFRELEISFQRGLNVGSNLKMILQA